MLEGAIIQINIKSIGSIVMKGMKKTAKSWCTIMFIGINHSKLMDCSRIRILEMLKNNKKRCVYLVKFLFLHPI